jgi:murein DD-endopeptidase MepM/ murein hydrolase activator NlpD
MIFTKKANLIFSILLVASLLSACAGQPLPTETPALETAFAGIATQEETPTPLPTRQIYEPGTLVDYIAQDGDTLTSLAAHFNSTEKEIRLVNPTLPEKLTTLPPGFPMQIPIYYKALWGNPYQIMPDSLFVNGPAQRGFDTSTFVDAQPGWLKGYSALAGDVTRQGGDLIDYVANEFSISPRLLLAIAEYQAGALSNPILTGDRQNYPLGYEDQYHRGFYLQLVWAADQLNAGYYQWQTGRFASLVLKDGSIENPDPWQNAATVGIQDYFSQVLSKEDYHQATYANGLNATYTGYFGDPWQNVQTNIPGSLAQPELTLPFAAGKTWSFTGAPHASWGSTDPLGALDFAPPSVVGKCASTIEQVVAVADGEVSRNDVGVTMLDLDSDGDDRTGWVIMYLHISSNNKVRQGTLVKQGDPLGYPSCEGGSATGTHIHIARKYNGEWIAADSAIPFVMDGWLPHNGSDQYKGTLTRAGHTVTASENAAPKSMITAGK